jgi:hypothetical protein
MHDFALKSDSPLMGRQFSRAIVRASRQRFKYLRFYRFSFLIASVSVCRFDLLRCLTNFFGVLLACLSRSITKLAEPVRRHTSAIVQNQVRCADKADNEECVADDPFPGIHRYNTTAPMYGVSLTSGQPVTIVQKFPDLLQQVVFEVCE